MNPKLGEVYFVDLGIAAKPRNIVIVSVEDADAPVAVVTGVSMTRQFHDSIYEVTLPKLPWMRDQSFINAQSLAPYKTVELQKLIGKFNPQVMGQIQEAIRHWLDF